MSNHHHAPAGGRRPVLAALLALVIAACGITAVPAAATAHRAPRLAHTAGIKIAYNRDWVCTLGGATVAAGWTFLSWGFAPASIITMGAILSGGSFTAGCQVGEQHGYTLIDGLPRLPPTCWYAWLHHSGRRSWGRTQECIV